MPRTHASDARSESAATSVTAVGNTPNTLPAPGQVKVVGTGGLHKAIFNTGGVLGYVEAYGRSEIEARDAALNRAAELFVARERRMREASGDEFGYVFGVETKVGTETVEPCAAAADRFAGTGSYL